MARILVTGAAGFIGRALCPALAALGHHVIAGVRSAGPPIAGAEPRLLGNITGGRVWSRELRDVDIVVHLAQRAHRRAAAVALADEPAAAAGLARAAAAGGARRFLYVSSIKAMGEATLPGRPFRTEDPPSPGDAYGRAKHETETALAAIAAQTGIELVVLRPPLVYSPGVGGNFRLLVRLAASGLPLPFDVVDNRRSLLFLDNLVDLIAISAQHPAAAGRVWLAADGADLSTAALIGTLARGLGRTARLFGLPAPVFAALRALPVLGPAVSRLTLSLQVNDAMTRAALGWSPSVSAEAGLIATARAFATA